MVRYVRPHGRFAHYSCKNAVRQPPVLASCIEIYYFKDTIRKISRKRGLPPANFKCKNFSLVSRENIATYRQSRTSGLFEIIFSTKFPIPSVSLKIRKITKFDRTNVFAIVQTVFCTFYNFRKITLQCRFYEKT